jgi:hypothetical protein
VDLKVPDPRFPPAGHQFDLVADAQGAASQRAGHDGTEAWNREDPVGWQPEDSRVLPPAAIVQQAVEQPAQFV